MKYSINQILADVFVGNPLTEQQKAVVATHLAREEARKAKARELKARKYQMFHANIAKVLRLHPHTGFTATEIQLLLPNVIQNHISSQRVSRHLAMMLDENFGINSCQVLLCDGFGSPRVATLWFTGCLETHPSRCDGDDRPIVYRDPSFWQEVVNQ